jgi:hypothetical protein
MTKICVKCHSTMPYDPYFKAYVCRQCGNSISFDSANHLEKGNVKIAKSMKAVPLKAATLTLN